MVRRIGVDYEPSGLPTEEWYKKVWNYYKNPVIMLDLEWLEVLKTLNHELTMETCTIVNISEKCLKEINDKYNLEGLIDWKREYAFPIVLKDSYKIINSIKELEENLEVKKL